MRSKDEIIEDAEYEIQMLNVDKKRLAEALSQLIFAVENRSDSKRIMAVNIEDAKEVELHYRQCYMCQKKSKKWFRATHSGLQFCSANCINNYACGSDIV